MNADDSRAKWTIIDPVALEALTKNTSSSGVIFPIGTNLLPIPLQQMSGAVSYFVSNYAQPMLLANGVTAGGELAVVRTDGELGKAYNYIYATSGNGNVVFNGPYYHFPQHHFTSTSSIAVNTLFGHIPLASGLKP